MMLCSVMLRWYRSADVPVKPTHLLSGEMEKLLTTMFVSRVSRVVRRASTSTNQRLERGRSMLRIETLKRFSMRSFSSLSTVSAVTK